MRTTGWFWVIFVLILGAIGVGFLAGRRIVGVDRPTTAVDRVASTPSALWHEGLPPKDALVIGIFDDDYGRPGEVFDRWAAFGRWTGDRFIHSYNDDRGKMVYVVANRPPALWTYAPVQGVKP